MLQGYLSELILINIPESIVLSFVIGFFLQIKLEFKKIIMIAVINAFIIVLFRSIPTLSFGYHSIIAILFYVILFNYFFKENVIEIFLATIKTFILLIIYEMIMINLMTIFFKISAEELLGIFHLKILTVWLNIIFVFLTGYISLRVFNKKKTKEKPM